jgi:hypothetical protein
VEEEKQTAGSTSATLTAVLLRVTWLVILLAL